MKEIKPEISLPQKAEKGSVVHVRVKINHPMTSDNFLEKMLVSYRGRTVLTYMLTPGVSDNPAVGFYLKAIENAPVRVTFISNKSRVFEAEDMLQVHGQ